jgi:hypothetical protein
MHDHGSHGLWTGVPAASLQCVRPRRSVVRLTAHCCLAARVCCCSAGFIRSAADWLQRGPAGTILCCTRLQECAHVCTPVCTACLQLVCVQLVLPGVSACVSGRVLLLVDTQHRQHTYYKGLDHLCALCVKKGNQHAASGVLYMHMYMWYM